MTRSEPTPMGYVFTWLVLLGLTVLTWRLSHLSMGGWNTPVAIVIAIIKALLIAMFFMHQVQPNFVHRIVPMVAVIFLVLLIGVVLIESQTRFPLATPPGSVRFREPLQGQLD